MSIDDDCSEGACSVLFAVVSRVQISTGMGDVVVGQRPSAPTLAHVDEQAAASEELAGKLALLTSAPRSSSSSCCCCCC